MESCCCCLIASVSVYWLLQSLPPRDPTAGAGTSLQSQTPDLSGTGGRILT